jgi:hypothetical protein
MTEEWKRGKTQIQLSTAKTQFDSAQGGREREGGFGDGFFSATAFVAFWLFPVFQYSIIPPFRQLV